MSQNLKLTSEWSSEWSQKPMNRHIICCTSGSFCSCSWSLNSMKLHKQRYMYISIFVVKYGKQFQPGPVRSSHIQQWPNGCPNQFQPWAYHRPTMDCCGQTGPARQVQKWHIKPGPAISSNGQPRQARSSHGKPGQARSSHGRRPAMGQPDVYFFCDCCRGQEAMGLVLFIHFCYILDWSHLYQICCIFIVGENIISHKVQLIWYKFPIL